MVWLRCRDNENAEAKNRIGDKDRSDGEGDFVDGVSLPCADGGDRMSYRIFISSVQREFAKERKALAAMIRKDLLLKTFFEPFIFEESSACNRSAKELYLDEVRECDVYLGLFGTQYGNVDKVGVSPTEREYDLATELKKYRLAFVKRGGNVDVRETKLIAKVEGDVVRKSFSSLANLKKSVYESLFKFLSQAGKIQTVDWDAAFNSGAGLEAIELKKVDESLALTRRKGKVRLPEKIDAMGVLGKLKLIDRERHVANAGLLMFGEAPQKWFVSSEVKCAQFYGDKVVKPMPNYRIFEGDTMELVENALAFVMSRVFVDRCSRCSRYGAGRYSSGTAGVRDQGSARQCDRSS